MRATPSSHSYSLLSAWAWLSLCLGCAPSSERGEPIGLRAEAVVYGADDRVEAFAALGGRLRDAALHGTASILARDDVQLLDNGEVEITQLTLAQRYHLCEDEAFADQPSAGFCSGALVTPELLLTAGHCLALFSCPRLAVVFGFHYQSPGKLRRLTQADVYYCAEVLSARVSDPSDSERFDYGFIRLERAAAPPLRPASLRAADALAVGNEVALVGHGAGLPTKVDHAGLITDVRAASRDYFVATIDDFEAGSGSPVFDASGFIVGIAARGTADYAPTESGCTRSVQGDEAGGEQVTYASRAIDGLCERHDVRGLCGAKASGCTTLGAASGRPMAAPWLGGFCLLLLFRRSRCRFRYGRQHSGARACSAELQQHRCEFLGPVACDHVIGCDLPVAPR